MGVASWLGSGVVVDQVGRPLGRGKGQVGGLLRMGRGRRLSFFLESTWVCSAFSCVSYRSIWTNSGASASGCPVCCGATACLHPCAQDRKDKEKRKRMLGQSAIGSWKTEAEMVLR